VLKADAVYLPEGEKDVHTLEAWVLVASCNPGGAGNSHFYGEWAVYFRGRHIVILPDNDEPGRKHGAAVAAALLSVAASVRIVELPGLPEKGDVTRSFLRFCGRFPVSDSRSTGWPECEVVGDEIRGRRVFAKNSTNHGAAPECKIANCGHD
jgi:hypothetical protein